MTKPTEKKEGWGTGHPKEPITKPTELEKIIRNLEVRHTISGNMIEGEEEVVEKLQTLIKEERKKAVEGFESFLADNIRPREEVCPETFPSLAEQYLQREEEE